MVLDSQNLDMELINQDLELVRKLSLALACMDHIKLCHLCMDHMLLLMEDLLLDQIMEDIGFMAEFTLNMASAVNCPVSREIPDSVKTKLDEYLLRKRRKDN